MDVAIMPEEKFREIQEELFEQMLETKLPKLLRQSTRKQYLTTKDLKDDYGISYELQKYYRDEELLSFSQQSRKIWYDADDIDQFMFERKIQANK